MGEPALVGVPDPTTQLTLELGPSGITRQRVVVAAGEVLLQGPLQLGQRRRLIVDVVVDSVAVSRSKGEAKWVAEIRSADEAS